MAVSGSLEGLRNEVLDSIKGRKLGLHPSGYLQGQLSVRDVVTGLTAGSTLVAAGANVSLPNYGISIVGSTLTSGSTGSSGTGGFYTLADPLPGIRKVMYNPSTSPAVVACAAAKIVSTGGAAFGQVTLVTAGSYVELLGISTGIWVAAGQSFITTGGGNLTFV